MNNLYKWLLIGVVFLFLTAGISASYYFVYFLPTQAKQEQEHKLQLECKKLGEQIDKKINNEGVLDTVYSYKILTPEYFYNQKLKKCFYCGGILGAEVIIDAYTNEQIALSTYDGERDGNNELLLEQRERFDKKKAELFNEP